ncbi:MAG: transcription elongation factor GreA [Epulopiscium sp.]|nr:transcription elongation factor GreA [Candidatus Epulonipiscium sp.]
MTEKKVVLTYEGLKKLEEELDELKIVRRKEIAEQIKEARAQGDLSENAEYDAAKDEQAEVETRIAELEKILRNATVIDEEEVDVDRINIGCKVTLHDMEFDEEVVYAIVGSTEADPVRGRLSNESPVGAALLGKQEGDIVDIQVPEGIIQFKVIEISRQ